MDKQEAIRRMELEQFQVPYGPGIFVHATFTDRAIELINKIHEPQKVVVPKFVALLIGKYKGFNHSLYQLLDLSDDKDFNDWLFPNGKIDASRCDVLARAWLDGYEVEKEQLYYVNLGKHIGRQFFLRKNSFSQQKWRITELAFFAEKMTEQQIKAIDEHLWPFAEPVEV